MEITRIHAREILDSRGNPTVETDVILNNGVMGRASVPSGASTGSKEAYELRDEDPKRYAGRGVKTAIIHVNEIIHTALRGQLVSNQAMIDKLLCALDDTDNKSHLGANAILSVSLACARAYAHACQKPLFMALDYDNVMCMPVPMMNVLNGGAHADNNVDIQEFMILPVGASDFPSALQIGVEVFHVLKSVLKERGLSTSVGDEGGFAPQLHSNAQALDLLSFAVEKAGFRVGHDVVFALDVAASELYRDGFYHFAAESKKMKADDLIVYYQQLITTYPIVSIEDGLDEADNTGWQNMTAAIGSKVQLVGDDLFVTNTKLLEEGINAGRANAILIKPNQVGTLSETLAAMQLAKQYGYGCVMSHRSGETEDTFIADLAVATGCGQIKTGALCRTDRTAKYNQLLRINESTALAYPGRSLYKGR